MTQKDLTIIELTEENIESMIYEIRGQRVMLDFDLAKIYGYSTKAFNQQIKRNIEKFDEDFMFQLSEAESEKLLRSQKVTMNKSGNLRGNNIKYLPYAFTEKGIYMLMTVLRGELAIKQSKALIRLFEKMKNYIASSNSLETLNELLRLSNKVNEHDKDISEIKDQLEVVNSNFINPSTYEHFLIMNGEKLKAEVAYRTIYRLAKKSIYIVDDYISVETLHLLLVVNKGIEIIIASDNCSKDKLHYGQLEEFVKESGLNLTIKKTKGLCRDRWIITDYKTPNEQLFISGASSKDAGNKITTIIKEPHSDLYHSLIDKILLD